MKYQLRILSLIFAMILVSLTSSTTHALPFLCSFPCGGNLGKFKKPRITQVAVEPSSVPPGKLTQSFPTTSGSNWRVYRPKIYVAFGYFEEPLIDYYSDFIRENFEVELKRYNPNLQVVILPKWESKSIELRNRLGSNRIGATGEDIVQALMSPETVGLVFIGHTFKTTSTQSSVSLAGDLHPLPTEILSAATPAMRFVAILGCNGPGILKQNQVEYEYSQLPGQHVFYYNQDLNLSAGFLGVDHLGKVLNEIRDDLIHTEKLDFLKGDVPELEAAGQLQVRVRGVIPRAEPRYVMVNDRIVGVLGGNELSSVKSAEFETFTFPVPRLALGEKKNCDQITIKAAATQPDAPADNYLIETVQLVRQDLGVQTTQEKVYSPPLQFGLQNNRLYSQGYGVTLEGDLEEREIQYRNYILRSYKASHLRDPDPDLWRTTVVKGRFFDECI